MLENNCKCKASKCNRPQDHNYIQISIWETLNLINEMGRAIENIEQLEMYTDYNCITKFVLKEKIKTLESKLSNLEECN